MTTKSASAFAALLANLAFAAAGCSVFGGDDDPAGAPAADTATPARDDGGDAPKAPPVGGPATPSELTDALGVFVSPAGSASADGTHANPLATIQAGIDQAKRVGKRVYVCAGTFREALVLADSISVIGGLDCTNNEWRVGSGVSRIESPSSPAIRATDITSATRLEGLDVNAPNAATPSGSSIGMLAYHASGIVVARTKIVAGNAMKGDDGGEGTQLSNAATANGGNVTASIQCVAGGTCERSPIKNDWAPPSGGAQGDNTCVGAPGFVAQSGGYGGSGGLYKVVLSGAAAGVAFELYRGFTYATSSGVHDLTSAAGDNGSDGANATTGAISREGYAPADGTNGKNGATGSGGAGGDGFGPGSPQVVDQLWRGWGGAGGGAGGCPGLAGTAGKGGGASIAALLVESPITFEATELLTGQGGAGGQGTFGSAPTAGGLAGANPYASTYPMLSAKPGGRGGAAGISGNGSSGPSAGIAHVGAAPKLLGANKITPGTGGAAIAARSRSTLGVTKTIPATPAGLSKDILAL